VSVGIILNQELSTSKKQAMGSPTTQEFYLESLKLVPEILELLSEAELVLNIKAASD
jgi:flavine halogenase